VAAPVELYLGSSLKKNEAYSPARFTINHKSGRASCGPKSPGRGRRCGKSLFVSFVKLDVAFDTRLHTHGFRMRLCPPSVHLSYEY
jgi:hypothetical protein